MYPVEQKIRRAASRSWHAVALIAGCAFALILPAAQLHAAEQDQASSIRGSIIALDSARQTALRELEGLPPDNGEISDYKDFIIYLNTRILSYCRDLAEQAGAEALEGLPCPTGPLVSGPVAAPPTNADQQLSQTEPEGAEAQTQGEKTASLEGNFLASLGDFDDMLLKEEDKVAARVPSRRETIASGQAGTSGAGDASGDKGENGTVSNATDDRGSGTQGDQSGSGSEAQGGIGAGNGNQDSSANGVQGGTLPPLKDDDIVARQLREAAEKETDPELKKKLWEEYWKYKGKKT